MGRREDAQELLQKLRSCRAKYFMGKVDETQRGINFVLMYLAETDGEVIAGDLARELNVSTARIAAILKNMEKRGYITRQSSSVDARRTVIEITPEGIVYAEELKEQMLAKTEFLLDKVGKEDLEEFIRISNKIKSAFEK